MGTYKENMLSIWERYRKEVSAEPADLRELGDWRSNRSFGRRDLSI